VILARVVGTAVSTVKVACYEGTKVLVCEPVRPRARPGEARTASEASFLAVDSVQAGVGDLVLVAREGNAARQVLGTPDDPFHSVILGIVDHLDLVGSQA
jgi:microcompartment protein CcmK/EutM